VQSSQVKSSQVKSSQARLIAPKQSSHDKLIRDVRLYVKETCRYKYSPAIEFLYGGKVRHSRASHDHLLGQLYHCVTHVWTLLHNEKSICGHPTRNSMRFTTKIVYEITINFPSDANPNQSPWCLTAHCRLPRVPRREVGCKINAFTDHSLLASHRTPIHAQRTAGAYEYGRLR